MTVEWRSFYSGQELPQDAIKGGQEADGQVLYIARAHVDTDADGNPINGGIHPGKYGETTGRGALVPWGGKERYFGKYEILCGPQDAVHWIDKSGSDFSTEGFTAVQGGNDMDGTPIWVAQAEIEGATVPGKVNEKTGGAVIAFRGQEIQGVQNYKVLALA